MVLLTEFGSGDIAPLPVLLQRLFFVLFFLTAVRVCAVLLYQGTLCLLT